MSRFTGIALLLLLGLWSNLAASDEWYDEDWTYRMPIALDADQVSAVLNDFPVLINTTEEEAFVQDNLAAGVELEDGGDIVFTAQDGVTELPHEIEFFDEANGVLVTWVRVSELDMDEDTELFIYYGNADAGDMQQREAVWANEYRMVQHLQEEGGRGTDLLDSTNAGNDGEVIGTGGNFPTFVADGLMDGARFMTGNQQGGGGADQPHIRVPHSPSVTPDQVLTAEVWARADSNLGDGVNHHPIMFKGERIGWGANYHFRIAVRDGSQMTWGVTCGGTEDWFHAGTPRFGDWAHYAITFDGTTTRAYINGGQVGSSTGCAGQLLNTFPTQPLRSGWTPRRESGSGDQSFYRGDVDELRISAASRSPSWLSTQFNNQSNPSGFHTFGAQQVEITEEGLLISYWFDEDWAEQENQIPDQSGEGRTGDSDGAVFQPASSDSARPGNPGTCGYADIPDGANVETAIDDEINDSDSFTSGFWLRMTPDEQSNDAPSLVAGGDLETSFAERFEVFANFDGARELVFSVRVTGIFGFGGEQTVTWTPDENASNDPFGGEWVHIAVRHEVDEGRLRIYANGQEVAEETYSTFLRGGLAEADGPMQLGGFSSGELSAEIEVDEFRFLGRAVDEADVEALYLEQRVCATELARFEVEVPETASVCAPAPVTLTALDENGNTLTDFTGTADLTTSSDRGNWARDDAEGTLEPEPHETNDGAASYTFAEEDDGSVSLTLANESADRLTITATDPDTGESGTSDPVQFQENAFVISVIDDLGADFVAGRDHDIQVEAIRRNPENGECGLITDYDGNIDLKGWIERSGDDPGGDAPALSDTAGSDTMPDAEPDNNNTTLAFNEGSATAEWLTTDVGQYRLNLRDDSSGTVVDEEGEPIPVTGAGESWTVRPFGFHVSVTDNPGADSATGPAFMAAGRPFEVTLRAVAWQATDDGNEDGQPDGHDTPDPENLADLSDNPTTTAFGAAGDLSVAASSDLVAGPEDASDPALQGDTTIADFVDGEAETEVSYSEVGSISVLANLSDGYLGRPVTLIGRSGYVGRFHPELFTVDVNEGSFEPECNAFVYSGQEHGYDLVPELEITPRAYDGSGTGPLVSNYRGAWQLLTAGDVDRVFPDQDGDNGLAVTVLSAAGTLNPVGDDGRMTYLFRDEDSGEDDEYTYVKDEDARVDPFPSDLMIQVTEIDDGDAQLDPDQNPLEITPAGVEIRFGRLQLENAFGPETRPLIIPMRAEYWDGDGFALNTQEDGFMSSDCWQYNPSGAEVNESYVELDPGTVAENISNNDVFGLDMGRPDPGLEPAELDEEDARIWLRSLSDEIEPGDDNQERVTFVVPLWLQDLDADGNPQNPTATATFGVYRGHDRIIHWREVR